MTKASQKASLSPASIPAAPASRTPAPPTHLSEDAATWWQSVVADYDLEGHHLRLLQSACEAWDRMQQARQALADHGGLTFAKANGDLVTHPAVAVERDSRIGFARLVRELDLDAGAPSESRRPHPLAASGGSYACEETNREAPAGSGGRVGGLVGGVRVRH